jgi:HEPN domain-containing protein
MNDNEDTAGTFEDVLEERLPSLDDLLAKSGVELRDRPFRAAFEFIDLWILEVKDGEGRQFKPVISADIVTEKWFAALFQLIEQWYKHRYGAAFRATTSRALNGFVVLWSTAFELAVPRTVVEPDVPGESIWLRFPGSVLKNENPLSWLTSPPNLDRLVPHERAALASSVTEVAIRLRSINVSIMGIPDRNPTLSGLLTQTRNHIHLAARKAVGEDAELASACWDLHMAVECAFKALIHRRVPPFQKTHDLSKLFDRASAHLINFPANALANLSDWREAIERRYGGGQYVSLDDYWLLYLSALKVVESVLRPLVVLDLGEGQIKLGRPPWNRPFS